MKRDYSAIIELKACYQRGENISEKLRRDSGIHFNTPEFIEIAYDLQAGSYISYVRNDSGQSQRYASELAALLDLHMTGCRSLLDVGSGELTSISRVLMAMENPPEQTFACDISWSRIHTGQQFAADVMGDSSGCLTTFVADMEQLPLATGAVDCVTSSHALEPNGNNLDALLKELVRVARKRLVLFEPCYEINSEDGKARMDRLGYIRGMEEALTRAGASLKAMIPLNNVANPLNPTVCFVADVPEKKDVGITTFTVPGTDYPLMSSDGVMFSAETGYAFPVLRGIPVLRSNAAILASAMAE